MSAHSRTSLNLQPILPPLALVIAYTTSVYLFLHTPFWWDEGWNFLSAHTHIATGFYGKLLMGELVAGSLANGKLVVALVEIGFRLLGEHPLAGRATSLVLCFCSITCLFYLGKYLYNSTIASLAVLFAALLYAGEANPVFFATQAVGEGPMICFIILGLITLTQANRSQWLAIVGTSAFWALALSTKPQATPFIYCALLVGFATSLVSKRRDCAVTVLGCVIGIQAFKWGISHLLNAALPSFAGVAPIPEIYTVQAFVPFSWEARSAAFKQIYFVGIPASVAALRYAYLWISNSTEQTADEDPYRPITNVMLAALFASWLAWYTLFSIGWPRYLGPALFFGCIHTAELTMYLLRALREGAAQVKTKHYRQATVLFALPCLVGWFLFWSLKASLITLWLHHALDRNPEYHALVEKLNSLPSDSVIETYESELLFQLKPLYHYPPDALHVQLNKQTFLGDKQTPQYDPSPVKPDYLILGKYGMLWKLYHHYLENNQNGELLQQGGRYVVIRFNRADQAKNPLTLGTANSGRSRKNP